MLYFSNVKIYLFSRIKKYNNGTEKRTLEEVKFCLYPLRVFQLDLRIKQINKRKVYKFIFHVTWEPSLRTKIK